MTRTISLEYPDFTIHVTGYFTSGTDDIYYPVDNARPGDNDQFEEVYNSVLSETALCLVVIVQLYLSAAREPRRRRDSSGGITMLVS